MHWPQAEQYSSVCERSWRFLCAVFSLNSCDPAFKADDSFMAYYWSIFAVPREPAFTPKYGLCHYERCNQRIPAWQKESVVDDRARRYHLCSHRAQCDSHTYSKKNIRSVYWLYIVHFSRKNEAGEHLRCFCA